MTSRTRRVTVLSPTRGEDDRRFPQRGYLGPNTVNVLPDNRGFLYGFKGNHNVLTEEPGEWAGRKVVDAAIFKNRLGVTRRVFITDDWKAWVLNGTNVSLLKQFAGEVRLEQIQDLVIFLSITEAPYKWDGLEAVTFLGIREIPRAPEVRVAGGAHGMWADYFRRGHTWGMDNISEPIADAYMPTCHTQDRSPDLNVQQHRSYEWAISYYNTRGQVGQRSAPTQFVVQRAGDVLLDRTGWTPGWINSSYNFLWPIVEWLPDFEQEDIAGVVVWRTLNQFAAEAAGLFQLAYTIPLPCARITDTKSDGALSTVHSIYDGQPGPQGLLSAVHKDVVLIAGDPEDPRIVRYSRAGHPEDWPLLNAHKASDDVTAIVSLTKAVVIVTKSSIETIAMSESGQFLIQRVEATKGSIYGGTLIAYKDNVVGFWNSGFGIFDGFTFKQLNNTLGYLTDEVEVDEDSFAWVSPDGMLFVSTRTRGYGTQILAYHFSFNAWFRLDGDQVYCAWTEDDQVYVGGNSQLRAFNTAQAGSGVIEFRLGGLEEDSPAMSWFNKELLRVFLNFGSVGNWNYTIEAWADEEYARDPFFTGVVTASKDGDTILDDSAFLWDGDARWTAPKFNWHAVKAASGGAGWNTITIRITWTGDILLSALAAEIKFSDVS